MKRIALFTISCLLSIQLLAQYTVEGGGMQPYEYKQNMGGTGLVAVYLLNSLTDATITYTSPSDSVKFFYYQQSLADQQQVPNSDVSATSSNIGGVVSYTYIVSNLKDSRAYLAQVDGNLKAGIWIVNYAQHPPVLNAIQPLEDESISACENLKLIIDKADELFFYANNGGRRYIARLYTISYNSLKWSEENKKYEPLLETITNKEIGTEYIVDAPLRDTEFTLEGDQFAQHFSKTVSITSPPYKAVAVKGHIIASQEDKNAPNEVINEEDKLGGSAPVDISFAGYGNEPATEHYTWFIYRAQDMNNALARYTDRDISYKFDISGDFIVVLETASANSQCVDSTSVRFKITESFIDVPNYFSPSDSPGSNDEFRVAYRSLVSFRCTIFNRWGTKLYQWNDPAKGWNGKYKGSYVNTGVYFYVIEAQGADGKRYKLGGDINILRQK